jgi:hypothetical protein
MRDEAQLLLHTSRGWCVIQQLLLLLTQPAPSQ